MPIAACDEVNANLCPFMSLKKQKKLIKSIKIDILAFFTHPNNLYWIFCVLQIIIINKDIESYQKKKKKTKRLKVQPSIYVNNG